MRKLNITLALTLFLLVSCGGQKANLPPKISPHDEVKLDHLIQQEERDGPKANVSSFMMIVDPQKVEEVATQIDESKKAKVVFSDPQTGYIHFQSFPSQAKELLHSNAEVFIIDYKLPWDVLKEKVHEELPPTEDLFKSLYPRQVMKVDDLIDSFSKEYGQTLDGSSATIVVADTGLDTTRTDAFQDRIVGLYTIRPQDFAQLTDAEEKTIDGIPYLYAKIDDLEVKIERTSTLSTNRHYYLGYFTEKQFKTANDGYNKFHFSQSGKTNVIYPIVAFFDESKGMMVSYINVGNRETYGTLGGHSIEKEKLLVDFNSTKTFPADLRFNAVDGDKSSLYSSYRFMTRTDIYKNGELITDRNKGKANIGIMMRKGMEVTEDGLALQPYITNRSGQQIYRIGLVGFDVNGHGTHVAGLSAGYYKKTPQYSSGATSAKIVGLTFLDGGNLSDLFDTMHIIVKEHKGAIFNFSFGHNSPYNDTQSQESLIQERFIQTYHTAIVKAAGNEGPGIKSHGMSTSEHTINVANFYSSNARDSEGMSQIAPDQFSLSASSSHGPMLDGLLKPDIGAPGWATSVVPLAHALDEKGEKHFQFWSGTSMASPNLAGVVALLYDAAIKSGLANYYGAGNTPVSVDKILVAIHNSALPYSPHHVFECISTGKKITAPCTYPEKSEKTPWIAGGAGRIDAQGAWEILKKIIHRPTTFYYTTTKNQLNNLLKTAKGYFAINKIDSSFSFSVQLSNENVALGDLNRHEDLILRIPQEITWLSFSPHLNKKERLVPINAGGPTEVTVYIRQDQLIENGRVRPGVHTAVIKGYNQATPSIFEYTFPVTIVGYHTMFDRYTDGYQFSAQGFITNDSYNSYFFPVDEDETVIVDVDLSALTPGDLFATVYWNGEEIDPSELESKFRFVSSNPNYGAGRNHLRYMLHNREKGLYEVVLHSSDSASYPLREFEGSYFNLFVSRMKLTSKDLRFSPGKDHSTITLEEVYNPGAVVRLDDITAFITSLEHREFFEMSTPTTTNPSLAPKGKSSLTIPLEVYPEMKAISLDTDYFDDIPGTDIDIELRDDKGLLIKGAYGPTAKEHLYAEVKPGNYQIIIKGESLPQSPSRFELVVKQYFSSAVYLSSDFTMNDGSSLQSDFRFPSEKSLTFKGSFETDELKPFIGRNDYYPLLSVNIWGLYGHNSQYLSLLRKEIPLKKLN